MPPPDATRPGGGANLRSGERHSRKYSAEREGQQCPMINTPAFPGLVEKDLVGMPLEKLAGGPLDLPPRQEERRAAEPVVLLAVVEVGLQSPAHTDAEIWAHADIAMIEERVDVGAEQEAVVDAVSPASANRLDMGSLKNGQSLFPGYGAASVIDIGDKYPEGALTEAGSDESWVAPHRALVRAGARSASPPTQAILNRRPERATWLYPEVV